MATVQQTVFTESAGSAPLTPYAAAFVFILHRAILVILIMRYARKVKSDEE